MLKPGEDTPLRSILPLLTGSPMRRVRRIHAGRADRSAYPTEDRPGRHVTGECPILDLVRAVRPYS